MNFYQTCPASATSADPNIAARRSRFAREAVRLEFAGKDAKALDQGNFVDHPPGPRPLGQVVPKVTNDTSQRALRHWLGQAARADSEEEREAALRTAHKIARVAGLKVDLPGRRAA